MLVSNEIKTENYSYPGRGRLCEELTPVQHLCEVYYKITRMGNILVGKYGFNPPIIAHVRRSSFVSLSLSLSGDLRPLRTQSEAQGIMFYWS